MPGSDQGRGNIQVSLARMVSGSSPVRRMGWMLKSEPWSSPTLSSELGMASGLDLELLEDAGRVLPGMM